MLLAGTAFAYSPPFFDNFQSYSSPQDTAFQQLYLRHILDYGYFSSNVTNETIIQAPFDSLVYKFASTASYFSHNITWVVQLNESRFNTTYPFTFDYLLRNGSQWGVGTSGGNLEFYFYFFTNHSNVNRLNNYTTAHGYLLAVMFPYYGSPTITVTLSRCPTTLQVSSTTGRWSCPQTLSSSTFNDSDVTAGVTKSYSCPSSGMCWTANADINLKLVVPNNGSVLFFWSKTGSEIQRFSYTDPSPLFNNGSIIFGYWHNSGDGSGSFTPYIDDLEYLNYSDYIIENNFTVVGYPSLINHTVDTFDSATNKNANWLALNQWFKIQFTMRTPVGMLTPISDVICPSFIPAVSPQYRIAPQQTLVNGVVYWTGLTSDLLIQPNTGACAVRKAEVVFDPTLHGYGCYGLGCLETNIDNPYFSVSNTTEIVLQANSWCGSGLTGASCPNLFKALDGSSLVYVTSEIACTQPTNLTVGVQWMDDNGCAGTPYSIQYEILHVNNIGINTLNGSVEPCDILYSNGSCYYPFNGTGNSSGIYITPNITNPPTTVYNSSSTPSGSGAQGAGITNVFDPSQSGSIWTALLSPAFIGLVICIILALMGAVYGGQLIGAMGFIGAFFFMTWFGLFPLWVGLGVIVLASFVTVYMIRDIFTGD
jgi:hypothetical protein